MTGGRGRWVGIVGTAVVALGFAIWWIGGRARTAGTRTGASDAGELAHRAGGRAGSGTAGAGPYR